MHKVTNTDTPARTFRDKIVGEIGAIESRLAAEGYDSEPLQRKLRVLELLLAEYVSDVVPL